MISHIILTLTWLTAPPLKPLKCQHLFTSYPASSSCAATAVAALPVRLRFDARHARLIVALPPCTPPSPPVSLNRYARILTVCNLQLPTPPPACPRRLQARGAPTRCTSRAANASRPVSAGARKATAPTAASAIKPSTYKAGCFNLRHDHRPGTL